MHQRIAGCQGFELVRRGDKRLTGQFCQSLRHPHRVFGMSIQPSPYSRATQGQLTEMRDAGFDMFEVIFQHRRPAGNFLAQRQWRSILKMGATDFNDIVESFRLGMQRAVQRLQLWDQMLAHRDNRRHMHCGRENVVGALAFVDVVVGVDPPRFTTFASQQLACAVGQHFVHVHVGLGAGTGLPDRQWEFIGVLIRQHFIGSLDNRLAPLCRQQSQIHIDAGCRPLGHRQRMDQRRRHFF
ncbi:hypothetical protein D3C80_1339350 [compost metagenome]